MVNDFIQSTRKKNALTSELTDDIKNIFDAARDDLV